MSVREVIKMIEDGFVLDLLFIDVVMLDMIGVEFVVEFLK